jgi:hypothetical protein
MSQHLRQAFLNFRKALSKNPTIGPSPLLPIRRKIWSLIERSQWEPGEVHAAYGILMELRDRKTGLALVRKYLRRPLSLKEEKWARSCLMDQLALLRRHEACVREQKRTFEWALAHLKIVDVMWLMCDATQGMSWFMTGRGDEWVGTYRDLLSRIKPSRKNRSLRFHYAKNVCVCLSEFKRPAEAVEIARYIRGIADEEEQRECSFFVRVYSHFLEMEAHAKAGDIPGLLAAYKKGRRVLLARERELRQAKLLVPGRKFLRKGTLIDSDPIGSYRVACCAMAYALYVGHQYRRAVPLWEKAFKYGAASHHAYHWHAASVWAVTRSMKRVLPLIRRVARLFVNPSQCLKVPEFDDMMRDPGKRTIVEGELAKITAMPA